jgi:Stress responsive A/B Barrel Domain
MADAPGPITGTRGRSDWRHAHGRLRSGTPRHGARPLPTFVRPMIYHIVCFRFTPGTSEELIAAAGAALLRMGDEIPDILGVRWGPNFAPSSAEYSHVLVVMADDMPAVSRYLEHPVHQDTVARFIAPIREARLAIDVEL